MPASPSVSRAVARFVRRRRLWGPSDRLAVAVSGGSDSVALAFILRDLEGLSLGRVVGVIHVNHQLRGVESDEDEAFSVALAARLGWPIDVSRADVARLARERKLSLEAAARDARYTRFESAAERLGATVIVTGHTADDQAETVLLRLLRGAGTRGLSGIRARRGLYARPLLECRRAGLRRELARRKETFREDASNFDHAMPRNRLRHELMPVVERLAPGGVRALARLAELAEEDEAVLTGRAIETAGSVVLSRVGEPDEPGAIAFDAAALRSVPPAIGRRVLRALVTDLLPGAAPSAAHFQAIWRLACADKGKGHLDLAGLTAERRGAIVTLRPGPTARPPRTPDRSLSTMEAGSSDPARTEAGSSDPARAEAGSSDPARTEAGSSDPARQSPKDGMVILKLRANE